MSEKYKNKQDFKWATGSESVAAGSLSELVLPAGLDLRAQGSLEKLGHWDRW